MDTKFSAPYILNIERVQLGTFKRMKSFYFAWWEEAAKYAYSNNLSIDEVEMHEPSLSMIKRTHEIEMGNEVIFNKTYLWYKFVKNKFFPKKKSFDEEFIPTIDL